MVKGPCCGPEGRVRSTWDPYDEGELDAPESSSSVHVPQGLGGRKFGGQPLETRAVNTNTALHGQCFWSTAALNAWAYFLQKGENSVTEPKPASEQLVLEGSLAGLYGNELFWLCWGQRAEGRWQGW